MRFRRGVQIFVLYPLIATQPLRAKVSRLLEAAHIAAAFLNARHLDRLRTPESVAYTQGRRASPLVKFLLAHSPYYRALGAGGLLDFPIIDKSEWITHFDTINTVGLTYRETIAFAAEQERTRNFDTTLKGLTVGLSTGTSGRRGVFLVSPLERLTWLGVMLAKLVPDDPLRKRRVAFVLRAGSPLYATANRGPITFRYFDMLQPWNSIRDALAEFAPDMLIAPAGVLRQLADEGLPAGLAPERVISVAECLYADDEAAITRAFGHQPGEVYQATEGLIATRCDHGTLHLNEAYMKIEKDWIDKTRTRFMPIVTDFLRRSQPIVRYRLDDILVVGPPCACGRAAETIASIEGRRDDVCYLLNAAGGEVNVFPDLLVRAVLEAAPALSNFQLIQNAPGAFVIDSLEDVPQATIAAALARVAGKLGALAPVITIERKFSADVKRRRVVNRMKRPQP